MSYRIIARDANGEELYSLASSVLMKNMEPGMTLPAGSLFSTPSAALYLPGDGIKFWTESQAILPRLPSAMYSCGCNCFGCSCLSPPGNVNNPPN